MVNISIIASILIVVSSCSTYKARPLSLRSFEYYSNYNKCENISFSLKVYDTAADNKDMFYFDLTKKNIIPILIIIKNDNNDDIAIDKNTIELNFLENVYRPLNGASLAEEFKLLTGAYPFIPGAGLGAFLGLLSAQATNRRLVADWQQKELPDRVVLPPGEAIGGFLFFKLPPGLDIKGAELRILAEKNGDGRLVPLVLKLADH